MVESGVLIFVTEVELVFELTLTLLGQVQIPVIARTSELLPVSVARIAASNELTISPDPRDAIDLALAESDRERSRVAVGDLLRTALAAPTSSCVP
jgi:hypothetical protein